MKPYLIKENAFLLILTLTVSCQGFSKKPVSTAENDYQNYCAGCHGEKLEEFYNREWQFGKTPDDLLQVTLNGIENMGMPAFEQTFTTTEARNLVDYILHTIANEPAPSEEYVDIPDFQESEKLSYRLQPVVDGLEIPWGMAFLPNGDMLITERSGTLLRFANGELHEISNFPQVFAVGQGGLMDVVLHPDYLSNKWIYFSYSAPDAKNRRNGNTVIMRAMLNGNQLINQEVLFEAQPKTDKAHHFGSRITFDNDGYMYFSVGDRGNRDEFPQTLDNDCGKIHRLYDNGNIPDDNPFIHTPGANPSIYSYGHRNTQGLKKNPWTGDIWSHEHGPRGGDEINIIKPGLNYGWPVISYGINYDGTTFTNETTRDGMKQPMIYWDPSIAPCGMTFVTSDKYKNWKGNLLIGSLRFKYIVRCEIENNKVTHQELLFKDIGRVRNVAESPDGYIYIAVETPGKIYKLIPGNE